MRTFWQKCGNAGKMSTCGISRTIAGWLTPMNVGLGEGWSVIGGLTLDIMLLFGCQHSLHAPHVSDHETLGRTHIHTHTLTLDLSLLFGCQHSLHAPQVSDHETLGREELVVGHLPRLLQVRQLSPLTFQQTTHWVRNGKTII